MSGNLTATIPVALLSGTQYSLNCVIEDEGTALLPTVTRMSGSTLGIYAINTGGTYGTYSPLDATTPFTWATGDNITVTGIYEAA